jgi:urease accessory protein
LGHAAGLAHGFIHPLAGIDHVLAMGAVGVVAYQLGARALWLIPAAFVLVMALGGALGIAKVDIPHVETGIALSVAILGAIVALGMKSPVAVVTALAGTFALFHGHAHGAEMPAGASGLGYAAGFLLGTALLHIAGIGLGFLVGRLGEARGQLITRGTGVLTCLAGILLLVNHP